MEVNNFPVTLAYNMQDKKIGCVLIQSVMGATIPNSWVSFNFSTEYWELNAGKCQLYTCRSKEELQAVISVTKSK
jgi:hypothetical protein